MNIPLKRSNTLTVSQLNQRARQLLEIHFEGVKVEGELSNLSKPSSGHWYFTLKDSHAQIRCALFKSSATRLNFTPKEGDHLIVTGKISLYENRGDYQLIASTLRPAGEGTLQKAYLALKKKLTDEGIFDAKHKQTVPTAPARIALITSASGAAVFDVLTVLKRRSPYTEIDLYSTPVQGNDAPKKIIQAISYANRDQRSDVILLTRGGGSLEDLWCFNDESLARCIASSSIPIVSAIGHEIDFTLADFSADARAATPSAAAEQLSLDVNQQYKKIQISQKNIIQCMQQKLQQYVWQLSTLQHRIQHPTQRLQQWNQRLDNLDLHLQNSMQQKLHQTHQQLTQTSQLLDTLSPLKTLSRGYSILQTLQGETISSTQQVQPKQSLNIRLHTGQLRVQVIT
jgi:exodeoxyribonuclease VII large subunit